MRKPGNKVAVIGAGNVGASCAFSLLHSGLVSDLLLIDQNAERAVGEAMDLSHGLPFVPDVYKRQPSVGVRYISKLLKQIAVYPQRDTCVVLHAIPLFPLDFVYSIHKISRAWRK